MKLLTAIEYSDSIIPTKHLIARGRENESIEKYLPKLEDKKGITYSTIGIKIGLGANW